MTYAENLPYLLKELKLPASKEHWKEVAKTCLLQIRGMLQIMSSYSTGANKWLLSFMLKAVALNYSRSIFG